MKDYKEIAESIFNAGVDSVKPDKLINAKIKLQGSVLSVADKLYYLNDYNKIYVIGFGKASGLMALAIEEIMGDRISEGLIIVKYGHACKLNRIKIREAGHPVPDENGIAATKELVEIASKAGDKDLVICLISGGASALLADFPEGFSLEDLKSLNSSLLESGAKIRDVNTIRKHFSNVKGGQLARIIYPASIINLVLSDVVGDGLSIIASGPTYPDDSTYLDAINVLDKYGLMDEKHSKLASFFIEGKLGKHPETPKKDEPFFEKSHNIIIGNNRIALEAATQKAVEFGFNVRTLTPNWEEDVCKVADYLLYKTFFIHQDANMRKPLCIIAGGETTLQVNGNGLGGRNQHFALYCAKQLAGKMGITVLCAGTDGTDGPTDAAGAVVDCHTFDNAREKGLNIDNYLERFDSYNFFKQAGGHIITGNTLTNVMDLIIAIVV
jgi:glycerate-2-kinase